MSGQRDASQENGEVRHVKQNESDKDPNISPPIRVLDAERKVQGLVCGLECAELTSGGEIWVGEVTPWRGKCTDSCIGNRSDQREDL